MQIFVLVSLVAFAAGAINAIAGGGTFLTFPMLTGLAGLTDQAANMTSTIGLWPATAASVLAAKSEFKRLPRGMVAVFVLISMVGAVCGAVLLRVSSAKSFSLAIPWLLAFATILFAFSKPIARWAGRKHGDRSAKWTWVVGAIQFIIAIYTGYFGAGAGVLMLAGLAFAGLDDINQMNAMKVLLSLIMNGIASVIFLFGPVDWRLAGAMAAASAVGGFLGMSLSRRVPQQQLRYLILAIGIILTAIYFIRNYGLAVHLGSHMATGSPHYPL